MVDRLYQEGLDGVQLCLGRMIQQLLITFVVSFVQCD